MKLEDKCKRYIIKRLLNVSCEIFCTRSYSGEAFASSCVLRHMNSCRIFHNTHSITYNYFLGKRQWAFIRTGVFIKVDTITVEFTVRMG